MFEERWRDFPLIQNLEDEIISYNFGFVNEYFKYEQRQGRPGTSTNVEYKILIILLL